MNKVIILAVVVLLTTAVVSPVFAWSTAIIEAASYGQHHDWYSESSSYAFADSMAKSTAVGCTPKGTNNAGSRYASVSINTSGMATYTPVFDHAGYYDVYVTWGSNIGAVTAHDVVYKGGTFTTTLDQSSNAGLQNLWNKLGNFAFDTSNVYYVKQYVTYPQTGGRITADAVKFVYTGPIVPEPGSALGLCTGLAGVAGCIILRRRRFSAA